MTETDQRIYAIGDIHGCRDKLLSALGWIESDLDRRPNDAALLVFLGDYVDRGVDSRGVIDLLLRVAEGPQEAVFLRGNHDVYFLDYLAGQPAPANWPGEGMGGTATLASYGVGFDDGPDAARRAVPASHQAFLDTTALWHKAAGYLFVHAGIRPGTSVEAQDPQDLIFIREPFLSWTAPHEAVVVHGHTPTQAVTDHGNRIAVDTGAVFGGPLSVLILGDGEPAELRADGLHPVRRARTAQSVMRKT